jgi:hypothetical protein
MALQLNFERKRPLGQSRMKWFIRPGRHQDKDKEMARNHKGKTAERWKRQHFIH